MAANLCRNYDNGVERKAIKKCGGECRVSIYLIGKHTSWVIENDELRSQDISVCNHMTGSRLGRVNFVKSRIFGHAFDSLV